MQPSRRIWLANEIAGAISGERLRSAPRRCWPRSVSASLSCSEVEVSRVLQTQRYSRLHKVALTPPPNTVFHVAASIAVGSSPGQHYELWTAGSSYRFIKFGYEAAWNGSTMSSYDAASNTMYVGIYSPQNHAPVDTAAAIRSLIASGQAQVAGSAVVDGVPAYVVVIVGSTFWQWACQCDL